MELIFHESKRPLFTRLVASTVYVAVTTNAGRDWQGAGVVVTRSGYVVTAGHLLNDVKTVTVTRCLLSRFGWNILPCGTYKADLIDQRPKADIALLKMRNPPLGLTAAHFGNSNHVDFGTTIYRAGNDDIGPHLMTGHVLDTGWEKGYPQFRTSMLADQGCSGGPLFNISGRLVGIALRVQSREPEADSVYAIPSNSIRNELLAPHGLRTCLPIMGPWGIPQTSR